jgi:4-hydroxybenzoate polyprenyltransferase
LGGAWTTLVGFLWLRILDEHKDASTDRLFRPELPVPRGLISLAELRGIGAAALAGALLWNALAAPALLGPLGLAGVWIALMTREFFVPEWLRPRPTAYLITHMLVMPLIDAYTTGLDWLPVAASPSPGLAWFLIVTFLNGCLLEVGRKIRAPEQEREGVDTYSQAWGLRAAPVIWSLILIGSAVSLIAAGSFTGTAAWLAGLALPGTAMGCTAAAAFTRRPTPQTANRIDTAAGLWTLASYLGLGLLPLAIGSR